MSQSPTTHPSLLVRLRDPADQDAWERFVELYAPLIHGYFRRRRLQDADAADLTQEVLQVVTAGAESFVYEGVKGAFRAWLYASARNKLQQFLVRRQRKEQASGDAATLELIKAIPAPDEDAALWEREHERRIFAWAAEKVRACVDRSTWEAFWLMAVDGKSGQQVAAALGISVGAVYVAKSRVVARLKRVVDGIEEP